MRSVKFLMSNDNFGQLQAIAMHIIMFLKSTSYALSNTTEITFAPKLIAAITRPPLVAHF